MTDKWMECNSCGEIGLEEIKPGEYQCGICGHYETAPHRQDEYNKGFKAGREYEAQRVMLRLRQINDTLAELKTFPMTKRQA